MRRCPLNWKIPLDWKCRIYCLCAVDSQEMYQNVWCTWKVVVLVVRFDRMIFQSESCRCRSCHEFCKHLVCLTGPSWFFFLKFWLCRIKKGFNMQFTKLYVHVQCLFFDWLTTTTKNRRYLYENLRFQYWLALKMRSTRLVDSENLVIWRKESLLNGTKWDRPALVCLWLRYRCCITVSAFTFAVSCIHNNLENLG